MNKRMTVAALAAALMMVLSACGGGGTPASSAAGSEAAESKPVTLKLASQDTAESLSGELLTAFKEQVEEQSGGTITVDLHFSGTLGSLNDMIEGISMGTIDMATAGMGAFQSYCDNMMIFDNYLIPGPDEFQTMWNSDVGQQVLAQLRDESGIYAIGYNLAGVGHVEYWTNKDYPSLDSLKNVNLRTNGTKTVNLACEAIGAVGVGVSNSEQYNAFQTGMVDAMSLDASNMVDMGFLQDGMYELDIIENYLASGLVISESTWEKLSAEQQAVLLACAKTYSDDSAVEYQDKLANTQEALAQLHIKLCSLSEADLAEINEKVSSALKTYYAEHCDADVLEQALGVLGK